VKLVVGHAESGPTPTVRRRRDRNDTVAVVAAFLTPRRAARSQARGSTTCGMEEPTMPKVTTHKVRARPDGSAATRGKVSALSPICGAFSSVASCQRARVPTACSSGARWPTTRRSTAVTATEADVDEGIHSIYNRLTGEWGDEDWKTFRAQRAWVYDASPLDYNGAIYDAEGDI
jgi:hypothetical protein